jgi:hypothetical protein
VHGTVSLSSQAAGVASAPLIKALWHMGRTWLAAFLDKGVFRPFAWLGYRLVAQHAPR